MTRLALSVVLLVEIACAQSPAPSQPLMAKRNADGSAMVAPGVVSPINQPTASTVLELPPLPAGKTTLLGGTIQRIDHIQDRLVLQVFGGSRTAVLFDERTNVFRDGRAASLDDLKSGERAYVDTTLDGTTIFARNIRIAESMPTGQSSGQIVDFRLETGELLIRDTISPEPVKMRLAGKAVIRRGDSIVETTDLRPGALVSLVFIPGNQEAMVQQVSILASPGATFVFAGQIEHLDLRRGLLVLVDPRDKKSYEVHFDATAQGGTRELRQGANVTVEASFDGTHYQSREITINPPLTK